LYQLDLGMRLKAFSAPEPSILAPIVVIADRAGGYLRILRLQTLIVCGCIWRSEVV
jgi:hypothetical protein